MRKARFRIDQVTIEGFRGFTTPQTIVFRGKNLFVFGPNGRGKSSVIEAIRWCLFGSQSGKEIEVRNTFYDQGDCVVTITLVGYGGPLQLKRVMRPTGDASRLTVRNAAKEEVPLKVALPELARIGHEQGTQVIFAAQQATGRQATVDLSDFTKVLCFYLHLEDAPELVKALRRKHEERNVEAVELAQMLAGAEHGFRAEIAQIQTSLKVILDNPPWGDGQSPTGEESLRRITAALEEQARLHGVACPKLSGKPALTEMRKWIEAADATSVTTRQSRMNDMKSKLQQLTKQSDALKAATVNSSACRAALDTTKARLSALLCGTTTERLRGEIQSIETNMSAREKRVEIARLALSLCELTDIADCPLCGGDVQSAALRPTIERHIEESAASSDDEHRLSELRAKILDIERTQTLAESQAAAVTTAESAEQAAKKACYETIELNLSVEAQEVQRAIDQRSADVESLNREINESATERQHRLKMVKNLEAELSYHEYRDRLDRASQSLQNGLEPTRTALAAYRDLLHAVSMIAELVDAALNNALDRIAPDLNDLMTEVYSRLTRQLSYDRVCISRTFEPPIRRELKVGSSRLAEQTFPPNVLNGQAAKALQLVPYFVFSRFQPEIMELDLLLIDDPSESFDTSHVESLVSELAEAAQHAQIIVATHEREKFEPSMKSKFRKNSYHVVNVETFDPIKGPTIE